MSLLTLLSLPMGPSKRAKRLGFARQRGGSLIETLMTVGFFGLFAAGMSSMSVTQMKAVNSMELRSELAVVKTAIAANIDCRRTSRAVCSGRPYILTRAHRMRLPGARQVGKKIQIEEILQVVASAKDETLTSQNQSKSSNKKEAEANDPYARYDGKGQWQIAARCKKASRRSFDIHLYVARKNKEGKYVRDPLSKAPWTWRDLFKGPICQGYTKR